MNMSYRRGALGGCLALASTIVAAEPRVLDTEQKAAAGVSTGIFTSHQVPGIGSFVTATTIDYADRALRVVRAATTPEALLAATAWTTINCATAGTLSVRMADTLPRVLKVRWNGCVMPQFGRVRTYNGPVSITLTSDTFRPARLGAIRLGNAHEDFTEQYQIFRPDQNDDTTNTSNVLLRGDIATFDAFFSEEGPVSADYKVQGSHESYRWLDFPDGRPSYAAVYKVTAEKLSVRETTSFGSRDDYELQLTGHLTATQTDAPPWGTFTDSYFMQGYRVHQIMDYDTWMRQVSVDGKINIAWNEFAGSGCMNGQYAFKTRTPLVGNADTVIYDAGELVANGAATVKFYSATNVPPGLPAPVNGQMVNMQVRDVGTFDYDVNSPIVLQTVGQCRL
jgi:hypothetical protein